MATLAQKERFKRFAPLVKAHYEKGDLQWLMAECGVDLPKLQQWARMVGKKRDKVLARESRINALKFAHAAKQPSEPEPFAKVKGSFKIRALIKLSQALIAAGFTPLNARNFAALITVNDNIIEAIKNGSKAESVGFIKVDQGMGHNPGRAYNE